MRRGQEKKTNLPSEHDDNDSNDLLFLLVSPRHSHVSTREEDKILKIACTTILVELLPIFLRFPLSMNASD